MSQVVVQSVKTFLYNTNVQKEYSISGFICHKGISLENGHYIAYILQHEEKQWYQIDDEKAPIAKYILQLSCWPMTPFIIDLPYDDPHYSSGWIFAYKNFGF